MASAAPAPVDGEAPARAGYKRPASSSIEKKFKTIAKNNQLPDIERIALMFSRAVDYVMDHMDAGLSAQAPSQSSLLKPISEIARDIVVSFRVILFVLPKMTCQVGKKEVLDKLFYKMPCPNVAKVQRLSSSFPLFSISCLHLETVHPWAVGVVSDEMQMTALKQALVSAVRKVLLTASY
jgi:hypothetical protein